MTASPKKSTRTPVRDMVNAAITNLKDKKGSSLVVIKKYIAANYPGVNMDQLVPHIKKYLRRGSMDGSLKRSKGQGATGSFKVGKSPAKKATPKKAKKAKKAKKPKKPGKKAKKPKKSPKKETKGKSLKKAKAKKPKKVKKAGKPKKPKAKKSGKKAKK